MDHLTHAPIPGFICHAVIAAQGQGGVTNWDPESAPKTTAATPAALAANGQFAAKIGALGLTPAQAEAVLALSREVIERVVWEVVPQLAETMIREEIARLTK